MIFDFLKKRQRKKKFWFENNQDAQGYLPGDNRIIEGRREQVRRTWNI